MSNFCYCPSFDFKVYIEFCLTHQIWLAAVDYFQHTQHLILVLYSLFYILHIFIHIFIWILNFDWRLRFEMWPLHTAWTHKRWPINMTKRKSMWPRICATGKMAIRLFIEEFLKHIYRYFFIVFPKFTRILCAFQKLKILLLNTFLYALWFLKGFPFKCVLVWEKMWVERAFWERKRAHLSEEKKLK